MREVLVDWNTKVNTMTLAYALKLGLTVRKTRCRSLENRWIGPSNAWNGNSKLPNIEDKEGRARFFQETFLVADTSMEVILGMPFLTLSMQTWFLQKKNLP